MTETTDLQLHYTVDALCLAEESLKKPLAAIFEEVQSEEGAELRTLRALVAAGRVHLASIAPATRYLGIDIRGPAFSELQAGKLIEKHGIAVVAEQVGTALAMFVAKVSGATDVH